MMGRYDVAVVGAGIVGLACALAESALAGLGGGFGVEVEVDDDLPPIAVLFGEAQGRVVVSCDPARVDALVAKAGEYDVPAARIGTVGAPGGAFRMKLRHGSVDADSGALAEAYFGAIPAIMDAPATASAGA